MANFILVINSMKQCIKCKGWKETSDFYPSKEYKNGLRAWCIKCENKRSSDYYLKHKKNAFLHNKKYYHEHKGELKERQKQYYHSHIKENKEYRNERKEVIKMKSKKQYMIYKQIMQNIKINGCAICGYNKCNASLDFHHVNPDNKKFPLSLQSMEYKDERIIEEINKCILLCKNCHYEMHTKNLYEG